MKLSHAVKPVIAGIFCALFCFSIIQTQAQEQKSLSYGNETMGVKISGPKGWFMTSGEKMKEIATKGLNDLNPVDSIKESVEKIGPLVAFSQFPLGSPREVNPNISLATETLPKEYIKTAMDYANASILTMKTMLKDTKVIKEPTPVTLSGKEGVSFTYEGTVVKGYLEMRIKSSIYVFVKGDLVYALAYVNQAASFDNNLKDFEESLNTFVLK
ncbi:MAG: PsbP-related protein [Candidatus Omnitrophota bacterium]|nr:PsbP-related protein [Candidatus Omnitrophota bacterium]